MTTMTPTKTAHRVSKRCIVDDITANPRRFEYTLGEQQVLFVRWKELPVGVVLVTASPEDRAEFGLGCFRVGKGEMHAEHIVQVNPLKMHIRFIDNPSYLEGRVEWGDAVPLQDLIIRDVRAFNAAF